MPKRQTMSVVPDKGIITSSRKGTIQKLQLEEEFRNNSVEKFISCLISVYQQGDKQWILIPSQI